MIRSYSALALQDAKWEGAGKKYMVRGMNFEYKISKKNLLSVESLSRGEATDKDIIPYINLRKRVGIWWYLLGHDYGYHKKWIPDLEEARAHASTEDGIGSNFGKHVWDMVREEGRSGIVNLGAVLIAEAPKGWDPSKNPDDGVMGNSYVAKPYRKNVKLVAMQYCYGYHGGWAETPLDLHVDL